MPNLGILRVLLLVYTLAFVYTINAQDAVMPRTESVVLKTQYLTIGAGSAYQTTNDEGMSPLRYQGQLVSAHLGYEATTMKKIQRWDLLFNYGFTKPNPYTNRNQVWEGYFDYVYLQRLRPIGDGYGNLYLGGAANILGNFRYNSRIVNTDLFYDVFLSASIASAVDYQFKLKNRLFLVTYQLSLPLLSYGFQPPYSGLFNVAPPEEAEQYVDEVLENSVLGSWNKFFGVKSVAELAYPLKKGNQLKLQYTWNFYSAKIEHHRVANADQILLFVLCFRL